MKKFEETCQDLPISGLPNQSGSMSCKTKSTFYNKAEVVYLYTSFYLYCFGAYVRMTQQIDRLNLIGLNRTILRSGCFSDNYFGVLKTEENYSAIYQIYPRVICVQHQFNDFNFENTCMSSRLLTNASKSNPYNLGQMRLNFGSGQQV